jgi:predicted CXXCH cytochrome family protein
VKRIKHQIFRLVMTLTLTLLAAAGAGGAVAGTGSGYSFGDGATKNEPCLNCHANTLKVSKASFIDPNKFGHTTHASIGCTSCHAMNGGHPDGLRTMRADCRECHQDIKQEYEAGIHAGKTGCSGCHNPHEVATPKEISGHGMNKMCSGCHERFEMVAKHGEWLPQADLHINMLPCITCHTGSMEYFIAMYIVKGDGTRFGRQEVVSYQELKGMAPGGNILALIDANGDNYVSLTELRNFNKSSEHNELRLQGMMTPETASHRFEIIDNRRNCSFCHTSGSAAMQTSYLAIPEQNGTYKRVAVEKGAVLDALYGTPDFYMMGSTKNKNLNYIGLAIICGGLVLPVGHGSLRFLTRKNRAKKEHQS